VTRLLERPGVLLSLFLATGLGLGGTLIHLTSPAPTQRTFERPPDHLCGHGVSEWLRTHDQD
jgi:hypothetical protein